MNYTLLYSILLFTPHSTFYTPHSTLHNTHSVLRSQDHSRVLNATLEVNEDNNTRDSFEKWCWGYICNGPRGAGMIL